MGRGRLALQPGAPTARLNHQLEIVAGVLRRGVPGADAGVFPVQARVTSHTSGGDLPWRTSWSSGLSGGMRARARSSTCWRSSPTWWCASRAATTPATPW
ncbi:MAG: hypothetical protein MZU95_00405 [Desulfomicrobium escambiense]|nr:hypothetical protein [Desulfomicrobium escambiense]